MKLFFFDEIVLYPMHGGGVQWLNGQCPNAFYAISNGASLMPLAYKYASQWQYVAVIDTSRPLGDH